MNHKTLFILSLVVILVGIFGLFSQSGTGRSISTVKTEPQIKTIVLAQLSHPVEANQLLTADDYEMIRVEVKGNEHSERDLSTFSNGSLEGFLVRKALPAEAYLTPMNLVSPGTEAFLSLMLKDGEVPYVYSVKNIESYLMDRAVTGSKVVLYLKSLPEPEEDLSGGVSNKTTKKIDDFVITKMFEDVLVLGNQKVSKTLTLDGKEREIKGELTLKLTARQLEALKSVEKAGELMLLPQDDALNKDRLTLGDIVPQFKVIKEIRGR